MCCANKATGSHNCFGNWKHMKELAKRPLATDNFRNNLHMILTNFPDGKDRKQQIASKCTAFQRAIKH